MASKSTPLRYQTFVEQEIYEYLSNYEGKGIRVHYAGNYIEDHEKIQVTGDDASKKPRERSLFGGGLFPSLVFAFVRSSRARFSPIC